MKKITILVALMSLTVFVACKKDVPPPAETTVEVVTPAAEPPAPEVEAPEEDNGTSVKIGKDGVDISTKNETKKTTIEVKNDGASMEVKK